MTEKANEQKGTNPATNDTKQPEAETKTVTGDKKPPEDNKQKNETVTQAEYKQARVLGGFTLDGIEYKSNDVIEADEKLINSLGTSVDPHPDAVKYCLDKEGAVIKHHIHSQADKTA